VGKLNWLLIEIRFIVVFVSVKWLFFFRVLFMPMAVNIFHIQKIKLYDQPTQREVRQTETIIEPLTGI